MKNSRRPKAKKFPVARDQRLVVIGGHLRQVREALNESLEKFRFRLNVSKKTLLRMEQGEPGIAIGTWLRAFTLMQVDQSIVRASHAESLLFALQTPDPVNIAQVSRAMQGIHPVARGTARASVKSAPRKKSGKRSAK